MKGWLGDPIEGPVRITAVFVVAHRKDVDKSLRAVLHALSGVVYADDGQEDGSRELPYT